MGPLKFASDYKEFLVTDTTRPFLLRNLREFLNGVHIEKIAKWSCPTNVCFYQPRRLQMACAQTLRFNPQKNTPLQIKKKFQLTGHTLVTLNFFRDVVKTCKRCEKIREKEMQFNARWSASSV